MEQNNKQQTTNNKTEIPAIKSYRDLVVYKKAIALTIDLVYYYSDKKLGWTEKYFVDQLIRAAASIGANLAEGYGRLYKQDYRRFVSIARGSSFELAYWADLVGETSPQDKNFLSGAIEKNTEILKMLTGLMKSLEK